MICLETVKRFCKEYWLIENYDQAMADETQTWHCHHRHEIDWALPREELIAIGRYYDVHYSELIFLTPEEHNRLHNINKEGYWKGKVGPNKGKEGGFKGKHHTEEAKQRISDSIKKRGGHSGTNNPNYGNHHTKEAKQRISAAKTGENNPNYKYHITEEELYDLYVVQGFTMQEIASMYGCSFSTIWFQLKKYKINKNG